ncbi:hypothetical protein [Frankia sp. AgW1.1]|uniref:hypothetical protein n=1 Tax=Frankia sp. AgW1.1 TaxID=1836971 RepID=UPI0019323DD2|nr:hypothetical protein [Frankia sp. AgW1.1]MBL7487070.1 hypothetical protein [Frankia sp. AgW1.1]
MNETTETVEQFAAELVAGTDLTWRIERNGLGDPLLLVSGPTGDNFVTRSSLGFMVSRPGNRGGYSFASVAEVRDVLVDGLGNYMRRLLGG